MLPLHRLPIALLLTVCHAGCGGPPAASPASGASPTATASQAAGATGTASEATTDLPPKPPAAPPTASAVAPTEPAAPAEPPGLPSGTKVLHVGDSMADALGKDLKIELEKRGVKNILKYKEATYIPQWAGWSMNLRHMLMRHDPDLVIVTLGGNEVAMPDPTIRAEPIRKIVEMIGDRPCVWVGAPLWGPHSGILKVIEDNCAPCRYVDTNTLVPNLKRLKDGVHPTIAERGRWARVMVDWLTRNRQPDGDRPWELKPAPAAR